MIENKESSVVRWNNELIVLTWNIIVGMFTSDKKTELSFSLNVFINLDQIHNSVKPKLIKLTS